MSGLIDVLADPDDYSWATATLIDQQELMGSFLSGLGGGGSPVDPCANTYEFVRKYDLRIDGVPYDLDDTYKHWRALFEDTHYKKVAMAGAQTGKSAWLMAMLARDMAGPAWGSLVGYYFPDKHLPSAFSKGRFKPFLRSSDELGKHLGAAQQIRGGKGTDAALTMTWGETTLFWMTIGGKTATEGLPLKGVYFDEVRRMNRGDIERAMERYSAQHNPIDVKVSTARYPETDIHAWFLKGDQRHFHTNCSCPAGVVLSLTFPDCIMDLRGASSAVKRKVAHAFETAGQPYCGMSGPDLQEFYEACYVCPVCSDIITDPREGWWEPHAPNNWVHSYQMPQLLSVFWPAGKILHKYETAEDFAEFMMSGLGLPYLDKNKQPVQMSHCLACVDKDLPWGEHMPAAEREALLPNCSMGVDVQAGYLIAVIKALTPSGKHRTVHVEVVVHDSGNPWIRLAELMQRYDIQIAIVDYAPDFTGAMNFARAFPGRVWLQGYWLGENSPKLTAWGEEARAKDQRGDLKFKHWVSMKRTQLLHWNSMRWVNRANTLPNPKTLMQTLPTQDGKVTLKAELRGGTRNPMPVGLDPYLDHQCRWVFRDILDDPTVANREQKQRLGQKKQVAEWVGKDPHFSHADMWASVALSRVSRARLRSA